MNTCHYIGENIKKYRSFKGVKQEVLARRIGISRVMMSRYENGHVNISIAMLTNIAQKLDISLQQLIVTM